MRSVEFQVLRYYQRSADQPARPSAREYLAKHPQDFVEPVMSSISVSWPHGDADLYSTDLLTGKRVINPEFISWCLDMKNWSVSKYSIASMPQLKGLIKTR
jgi:hypothetical protein